LSLLLSILLSLSFPFSVSADHRDLLSFPTRRSSDLYDFGVAHDGGYSSFVRVPADWVVPVPDGLSLFHAMAIGTAGLTAALSVAAMELNGLAPSRGPVIVTGATGGVGSLAVQILAGRGYAVTALTGKDSEHEFVRGLGASDVLSRRTLLIGKRPVGKPLLTGA